MSTRTFVIGDVHGCALTMQHLLFKIIKLRHSDHVYLLGDLIDRGPRSKEVIDTILRLQSAGYHISSIKGNHEVMLLDSCLNRNSFLLWIENGGLSTLNSFGVEDACEIPSAYRDFLTALPHYILLDNFVLCHAGINCQISDPFSDTVSMLWGRDLPVIPEKIGNRRVICGHTVHSLEDIANNLKSDRIPLDAGCVFNYRVSLGYLVALEIESMTIQYSPNIDV